MASRVVDGDGIWRSQKLKKVPVQYRSEYANLLPLAEANGCFECDPDRVWADVYSYNRPDVTRENVEEMLDQFETANMILRYEEDGKTYATFVGIDKPGRLPGPAHLARCKDLPPLPTAKTSQNLPLDSMLESICNEKFGFAEERKLFKKELRTATSRFGYDEILEKFDMWVMANTGYSGKRPICTFLSQLSSTAPVALAQAKSPNLSKVEEAIALKSDNRVFFHSAQKMILAGIIQEFGEHKVVTAFGEFFAGCSESSIPFAAKDFLEQAPVRLKTMQTKENEIQIEQERMKASKAAAVQQAKALLLAEERMEVEIEL